MGRSDEPPINSAEELADEWRWGYIHGYLHGWSDRVSGRQYGEGRNLRKPLHEVPDVE